MFSTSKRQCIITLSSAWAKYLALSTCPKQVIWLREPLLELAGKNQKKYLLQTYLLTVLPQFSWLKITQVFARNKHLKIKIYHIRELREHNLSTSDRLNLKNQLTFWQKLLLTGFWKISFLYWMWNLKLYFINLKQWKIKRIGLEMYVKLFRKLLFTIVFKFFCNWFEIEHDPNVVPFENFYMTLLLP